MTGCRVAEATIALALSASPGLSMTVEADATDGVLEFATYAVALSGVIAMLSGAAPIPPEPAMGMAG